MDTDLLSRLRTARAEERAWLITLDLLHNLPPALQAAAWAAAIPHWFNADILAALLEQPVSVCVPLYSDLQQLPFVEPFQARDGCNIHAMTRAAMLDHLWHERSDEYRRLSRRAAEYFAGHDAPEWKIEHAYHLLLSDPGQGANVLEALWTEWNNTFQDVPMFALAQVGLEHVEAHRCHGRSRAWAYFIHGDVERRTYHHQEAMTAFREALRSAEDDKGLEADCILALGDVHHALTEYPQAQARYEEALPICRSIGDRLGEANSLQGLGDVHHALGEYPQAQARYEEALPIYRSIGDRLGEANSLRGLGDVHHALGEYPQAQARYEEALSIYRAVGDRYSIAHTWRRIGHLCALEGHRKEAISWMKQSMRLCEEIGATYWAHHAREQVQAWRRGEASADC
jgi:tetratricopeptide (TPR) repeat protein